MMGLSMKRTDAIDDIVSNEKTVMYLSNAWGGGDNVGGSLLTMTDGSQWFHPSSGAKPVQMKPPTSGVSHTE